MSVLESYWPRIDEINRCIKAQAESAPESLLLAVHQPMSLWKQPVKSPATRKSCGEKDLLEAFLSDDLDTGTLLIPITGASGSGKSHAIRWLNAQLLRRSDADRFHIIRVPKSASLKSVINLILKPLQGGQYEQMQRDLRNATEAISLDNAVIQFRAGLEMALKRYGQELRNEVNNNPEKRRTLVPLLGHTQNLPNLLNDSAFNKFFDSQVLSRIIKRAVKGQDFEQIELEDENLPQFNERDLELPENLDVGHASQAVQNYYLATLGKPEERKRAIEVLNSIVDEATSNTFKLNQNLGGKTLQEIFLEIRVNLLKDNKELVLLVEDFAALTGIQETLLHICIQEAIRPEGQIYCVMRTALALTDGYLGGRATIATRAKDECEWVVRSELDTEEAILSRVINLTGAYLNAARHGELNVKKLFSKCDTDADLSSWLVPFKNENLDTQTEDILDAFERSDDKNHLFPFNKICLNRLTKKVLMEGGILYYNPRTVINRIIRETLLNNRDYFIKGIFPPPEFHNAQVKTDIAILLSQKVSSADNSRYQSFLSFWGGDPNVSSDLESINPLLYEAFSLRPLTKEYTKPPPTPNPSKETEEDSSPLISAETSTSKVDKFSDGWTTLLENWINGEVLGQRDASRIRNTVCLALEKFIDWNVVQLRNAPLKSSLFWIPQAKNNPSGELVVKIATDTNDIEGKLRKALLALVRHHENNWTWDYHEGQNDSIYYANYLEKMSEKVVSLYRKKADKELIPIAQGLLMGTLVLGAKFVATNNTQKLVETMLFECSAPPPMTKISANEKWDTIREGCYDLVPVLQNEFKNKCACYQGTGQKVLAVNYVNLHRIFKEISFYDDIEIESLNSDLDVQLRKNELMKVLRGLGVEKIHRPALKFQKIMTDWFKNVNEILGDDFDKDELLEELDLVIKVIRNEGSLWPTDFEQRQLSKLKKEFRESSVKDLSDNLDRLVIGGTEITEIIPVLAKLDPITYRTVDTFAKQFDSLISAVEKRVAVQMQEYEKYDSTPIVAEIKLSLQEISSDLRKLSRGPNETHK